MNQGNLKHLNFTLWLLNPQETPALKFPTADRRQIHVHNSTKSIQENDKKYIFPEHHLNYWKRTNRKIFIGFFHRKYIHTQRLSNIHVVLIKKRKLGWGGRITNDNKEKRWIILFASLICENVYIIIFLWKTDIT